jgi:hypothetical protein
VIAAARPVERGRRLTAGAVALAALVLAALYLSLVSSQGTGLGGVPLLFAGFFVCLGLLPLIGLRLVGFAASLLAAVAASAWLVMAMLTGFSIGIAVLPIAALAVAQLVFTLRSRTARSLAGLLLGLALGLVLPFLLIRFEPYLPPNCPSRHGDLSGTAEYPGTLYGDVSVTYTCRDGRLADWHVSPR